MYAVALTARPFKQFVQSYNIFNQTTKWAKGVLWSVQPFLRLTASLGCLTDILTIIGVVLMLTGFRLRPRRAYKALGLINSTLFGWQGLVRWISGVRTRSGVVATKKRDGVRHFGEAAVPEAECGPCPVFALYPGIRLATEEKSRKTLRQGSRKVPAGHRAADCSVEHPWLALWVRQVSPRSAQISAELPN